MQQSNDMGADGEDESAEPKALLHLPGLRRHSCATFALFSPCSHLAVAAWENKPTAWIVWIHAFKLPRFQLSGLRLTIIGATSCGLAREAWGYAQGLDSNPVIVHAFLLCSSLEGSKVESLYPPINGPKTFSALWVALFQTFSLQSEQALLVLVETSKSHFHLIKTPTQLAGRICHPFLRLHAASFFFVLAQRY
ncbi:hypothetical protein H113_08348 [Trichophyton rubrum MR1459]|nr:hypothetical protein H113_08348 [Trichophyton rubrum MR1459]KMQ42123.1 hypothetical protein HL42_7189 [Trichophyton rubrum]